MAETKAKLPFRLKALVWFYVVIGLAVTFCSMYVIQKVVQVQYQVYRERKIAEEEVKKINDARAGVGVFEVTIRDISIALVQPRPKNSSILSFTLVLRTTDEKIKLYLQRSSGKISSLLLELGNEFSPGEVEGRNFQTKFKRRAEHKLKHELGENAPDSIYFSSFIVQ